MRGGQQHCHGSTDALVGPFPVIVKLQSSRRFVASSSGHGIRNRCGSAFCNAVLNAHSQFSNTGRVLHLNDFSKLMRSFKKLQIFHVQSSYLKQRTNTNIQHAATSVQTHSLSVVSNP